MMTCPICATWNQDDPNCGHALYNGIPCPARFMTRRFVERIEIGGMAHDYLDEENHPFRSRAEHIERQARYALAGGWRKAS